MEFEVSPHRIFKMQSMEFWSKATPEQCRKTALGTLLGH